MPPMTDAEFLEEMARKSNVFSTDAGVRMTPEERDRLVALARARQWQQCDTHGGFDPNRAVGCPECVRDLRTQLASRDEELRLLRDVANEYVAAHVTMRSRFQTAECAQRYKDAARALYRCLADPRARREEKP